MRMIEVTLYLDLPSKLLHGCIAHRTSINGLDGVDHVVPMALGKVHLSVFALIKELQDFELSGFAHAYSPVKHCCSVAFYDAFLEAVLFVFVHH